MATTAPSDYRHLFAWFEFMGEPRSKAEEWAQIAADEGAPIDVTDKLITGSWRRIGDIQNSDTVRRVEEIVRLQSQSPLKRLMRSVFGTKETHQAARSHQQA